MTIRVSAIAAMSRNHVIGKDNKLPWHIPAEFAYFKRVTLGKPVIMGRKSYESLGKPLPDRTNIVISRRPEKIEGDIIAVSTVEEAVARAKEIAKRDGVDEIFIAGGSQIYQAALPVTDRFHLTVIDKDYEGDTFLNLDLNGWREVSSQSFAGPPPYTIRILDRP
jgi:dihydrofolate reductase